MTLTQKISRINKLKFSFSKSIEFSETFEKDSSAFSMYDSGYGLGISPYLSSENQFRGVFVQVQIIGGIFLFNLSGVNMKKAMKGVKDFQVTEYNNQIYRMGTSP